MSIPPQLYNNQREGAITQLSGSVVGLYEIKWDSVKGIFNIDSTWLPLKHLKAVVKLAEGLTR